MSLFEERLGAIAEDWVKSNAFLKPVSWGLEQSVQIKSVAKDSLHGVLQFWGVSSATDLEKVYRRVDELERALERAIDAEAQMAERIAKLESMLAQQQTNSPSQE